jgi:hypothetical protein
MAISELGWVASTVFHQTSLWPEALMRKSNLVAIAKISLVS